MNSTCAVCSAPVILLFGGKLDCVTVGSTAQRLGAGRQIDFRLREPEFFDEIGECGVIDAVSIRAGCRRLVHSEGYAQEPEDHGFELRAVHRRLLGLELPGARSVQLPRHPDGTARRRVTLRPPMIPVPPCPPGMVAQAVHDFLAHGLPRRSASTVEKLTILADKHIIPLIGRRNARELTADEVDMWLAGRAKVVSTRTLQLRPVIQHGAGAMDNIFTSS